MKLISLNIYGGKYYLPLITFINQHSQNTDIFCFQEVFSTNSPVKQFPEYRANMLEELSKILQDFNYFFAPVIKGIDIEANPVDFNLKHGLAIFVKKTIAVDDYQDYFIYKDKISTSIKKDFSDIPINIQHLRIRNEGKDFTILNFHGTSFPGSKLDTHQRIDQSEKIRKIIVNEIGTKILVGDFNLLPETQSIEIIELNMKNLIKEFNIKTTRSKLSPFYGKADFQKFADYVFVSQEINVLNFQVPDIEISDHLPMVLEFK